MATVFDYTTEERGSVVRSLRAKDSKAMDIYIEMFLFNLGSVCRAKRFKTGWRNSPKGVRKPQMMPDQMRSR
jgi:hypothetical protein